jgi:hypothetical protein
LVAVLTDIKVVLARNLGWSLYDIDRTDIRSLLRFMARLSKTNAGSGVNASLIYADQANFL